MPTVNIKKSLHAPTVLIPGRAWNITPAADCIITISATPGGDARTDHTCARLRAGLTYTFNSSANDKFLDGLSIDPNADVTPVVLTYTNVGVAPVYP